MSVLFQMCKVGAQRAQGRLGWEMTCQSQTSEAVWSSFRGLSVQECSGQVIGFLRFVGRMSQKLIISLIIIVGSAHSTCRVHC